MVSLHIPKLFKEVAKVPLTPIDIHNKEFSQSFRGYDRDEVNEFLDQVMKDYEIVIREKNELDRKLNELEEKLGHFTNIEETLNKSILIAQETAEELTSNAKKEAKLIIKEAEKNADRIVNDALDKSRRIQLETEELKNQGKVFRARLRTLVQAQLDMIENEDWEELEKMKLETKLQEEIQKVKSKS